MKLAATTLLTALLLCLAPGRTVQADVRPAAATPAPQGEIGLPEMSPEPSALICSAPLHQSSYTVGFQWLTCTPPGMCRDPDGYCECKAAGGTGPVCSHAYCI